MAASLLPWMLLACAGEEPEARAPSRAPSPEPIASTAAPTDPPTPIPLTPAEPAPSSAQAAPGVVISPPTTEPGVAITPAPVAEADAGATKRDQIKSGNARAGNKAGEGWEQFKYDVKSVGRDVKSGWK